MIFVNKQYQVKGQVRLVFEELKAADMSIFSSFIRQGENCPTTDFNGSL